MLSQPLYFDNHATTPVDPLVLEAMKPFLGPDFGNPSSQTHAYGWKAEQACSRARSQVASLLNCEPHQIVFTSGATESNATVLLGLALKLLERKLTGHFLVSAIEHKAVLDMALSLKTLGMKVDLIPVDTDGVIQLDQLKSLLQPDTRLISVMAANNEIGTLQPLGDLVELAQQRGILFHSDAVQAIGRVDLSAQTFPYDFLSLSGHKIYGPKGIGALFVRHPQAQQLRPLLVGGGQEKKIRPGTLNVPGIVGLGAACSIMMEQGRLESQRICHLRDEVEHQIRESGAPVKVNGHATQRLPHNLSLTFQDVTPDRILMALRGVAFSSSSACLSESGHPSHVLQAIGMTAEDAKSTVRLGFGRFTTPHEVQILKDKLSHLISDSMSRRRSQKSVTV